MRKGYEGIVVSGIMLAVAAGLTAIVRVHTDEITMSKVGRFVTDPRAGAYCQITLDSGEKIVVDHSRGGFQGGIFAVEVRSSWDSAPSGWSCATWTAGGSGGAGSADPRCRARERRATPLAAFVGYLRIRPHARISRRDGRR